MNPYFKEKNKLPPIQNIIFDLGAVIIPIDLELTYAAFAQLAGIDTQELRLLFIKHKIFEEYELGHLTETEFVDNIRQILHLDILDSDIISCWNALLLPIPAERIRILQDLRKKYNLYLLSNTNYTHILEVSHILQRCTGVADLNYLFDKIYYSYEIQCAKPSPEIFDFVLQDQQIEAIQTLFLDDNAANIAGADSVGIHTIQIMSKRNMEDIFV